MNKIDEFHFSKTCFEPCASFISYSPLLLHLNVSGRKTRMYMYVCMWAHACVSAATLLAGQPSQDRATMSAPFINKLMLEGIQTYSGIPSSHVSSPSDQSWWGDSSFFFGTPTAEEESPAPIAFSRTVHIAFLTLSANLTSHCSPNPLLSLSLLSLQLTEADVERLWYGFNGEPTWMKNYFHGYR